MLAHVGVPAAIGTEWRAHKSHKRQVSRRRFVRKDASEGVGLPPLALAAFRTLRVGFFFRMLRVGSVGCYESDYRLFRMLGGGRFRKLGVGLFRMKGSDDLPLL